MKVFRRQRQQFIFASLLGVVAVVNVLFFFILYRPVRSEYFRLQDSIEKARAEVQVRTQKIDRLEKVNVQLETSAVDRQRLFTRHFIPRSTGWSETLPHLEAIVKQAGVKNVRQDYHIADIPQYGLYSVTMSLPVSGPYSNVVNFIRDLEESETFFIINSINVHGVSQPGSAEVTMALSSETFFYQ
jgi:Tfp pilus assembly protein PilO